MSPAMGPATLCAVFVETDVGRGLRSAPNRSASAAAYPDFADRLRTRLDRPRAQPTCKRPCTPRSSFPTALRHCRSIPVRRGNSCKASARRCLARAPCSQSPRIGKPPSRPSIERAANETIHDYYGFQEALYRLEFRRRITFLGRAHKGAVADAGYTQASMLRAVSIMALGAADADVSDADIPVVQLSIQTSLARNIITSWACAGPLARGRAGAGHGRHGAQFALARARPSRCSRTQMGA